MRARPLVAASAVARRRPPGAKLTWPPVDGRRAATSASAKFKFSRCRLSEAREQQITIRPFDVFMIMSM